MQGMGAKNKGKTLSVARAVYGYLLTLKSFAAPCCALSGIATSSRLF
jgi:hypothetical protein